MLESIILRKGVVMKTAIVLGAGGFIGSHMVKRLKSEPFWVRGVDLKYPEFGTTEADDFLLGDLRDPYLCRHAFDRRFDEVYQFAADMGGAGYVFTGENDAAIMSNSGSINLNVSDACHKRAIRRIFYSSSACIYRSITKGMLRTRFAPSTRHIPRTLTVTTVGKSCLVNDCTWLITRTTGWRFALPGTHNIFGPEGTWCGGREKAPAAMCRKVAEAASDGEIEIWGDGEQTRSFLYVDECLEGTLRLMRSDWTGPVNIGSEEMVSIDELADMVMKIAGKNLAKKHIPGPLGVRGRNSDNRLIEEKLGWKPSQALETGLRATYEWISREVEAVRSNATMQASHVPEGTEPDSVRRNCK